MALIVIFSVFLSLCVSLILVQLLAPACDCWYVGYLPACLIMADSNPFSLNTGFNPYQLIGTLNQLRGDSAILLAVEITFFLLHHFNNPSITSSHVPQCQEIMTTRPILNYLGNICFMSFDWLLPFRYYPSCPLLMFSLTSCLWSYSRVTRQY